MHQEERRRFLIRELLRELPFCRHREIPADADEQRMLLRSDREFASMFSRASSAAAGTISSPVMCSPGERQSSSSAAAPDAQPRSIPRAAPGVLTKSARSTQSVLSRKCSAWANSGPPDHRFSNSGIV